MKYLVEAARAKHLDRVTLAYGAGAWLLVQAVATASPAFDWPAWALQAAIVAAVLGFPIVLVGTWALAVRNETGAFRPSRTDYHVLAVLGVVLAVAAALIVTIFWPHGKFAPSNVAQVEGMQAPANSIAVLPFANMSGDPAKRYFSDGISDELIGELSRVSSLRVAARTSSFAVEGKTLDVRTLARLLDVRSLLEGSVRESGARIRVEAELVDAASGFSVWSQTYDRDMTDILALQDDIAGSVTEALKAKLLGRQFAAGNARGIDAEAYRLYLQSKFYSHRGNLDDLKLAVELLKQVTQLAPNYANGFAALGSVQTTLYERYSKAEYFAPAEKAARRAIELDPRNLAALSTLAQFLLDKWQWNQALDVLQEIQSINANSSAALHLRSVIAYTFNYPADDIAAELKASQLDPLAPALKYDIALWYWNQKQYTAAAKAIQDVLRLRKGKFTDLDQECAIEASGGDLDGARRIAREISSYYASDPQSSTNCPFYIAIAEGNVSLARKIADAAATDALVNGGSYSTIGDCYRQIGDFDDAMKWFERSYAARDTLLLLLPYEKWQTAALLSDPRWKALWARQPIREWEAARARAGKILAASSIAAPSRHPAP